jgi:hypothetical protein
MARMAWKWCLLAVPVPGTMLVTVLEIWRWA